VKWSAPRAATYQLDASPGANGTARVADAGPPPPAVTTWVGSLPFGIGKPAGRASQILPQLVEVAVGEVSRGVGDGAPCGAATAEEAGVVLGGGLDGPGALAATVHPPRARAAIIVTAMPAIVVGRRASIGPPGARVRDRILPCPCDIGSDPIVPVVASRRSSRAPRLGRTDSTRLAGFGGEREGEEDLDEHHGDDGEDDRSDEPQDHRDALLHRGSVTRNRRPVLRHW